LTAISGSPFPSGLNPASVTVDPTGRFVYVVNNVVNSVSAYTINASTGALLAIPGSPFPTGVQPIFVAVDPTGKFAYVVNYGGNNVSGYTINAGTGALTAIAGSPFPAGLNPGSVAIDPAGMFAYVANNSDANVSGYAINPSTGALAAISGSPFPTGSTSRSVAVDPTGRFAYVVSVSGSGLLGYTINSGTGALTAISGSPFPAGSNPFSVAVDPTGKFAYVTKVTGGNVVGYTIDPGTGVLTTVSGSPFPAGSSPNSIAFVVGVAGTSVSITGTPTVGQLLTGHYIYRDVDGDLEGASTYRWLRDGTAIAGATSTNYTLTPADVGHAIRFEVTLVAATGTSPGSPATSAALTINNSAPTATSVNITGTPTAGQLLTGHYTYSDVDGDLEGTSTFRWLRDGVAISGATSITYTLAAADVGHSVTFEVTPVASTGNSPGAPATSTGVTIVNSPPTATSVNITGTPTVGQVLTGHYAYGDVDGDLQGTSTFRWLRDGVAISGATSITYTLAGADAGRAIRFEVTPVAATGASPGSPALSSGVAIFNSVPVATGVNITGTPNVGQLLTGNYTYGDVDGDPQGTSTFRWLRDGVAITGATTITYMLVAADAGHVLAFEVTPVAATGASPGTPVLSNGVTILNPSSGQFVYVANENNNNVSGYTVNANTGVLTAISGSPFSAGLRPRSVTVDPMGKFAYVANYDGGNVSGYTINAASGALTAIPGSPFLAGNSPVSVSVDPTGKFAYVANYISGNVSGYTIDGSTGALTAIAGSPFPAGSAPLSVTADPSGKFAYVANYTSGNASAYTIDGSTGALTAVSGSPFPSGAQAFSVAVDPTGKFAYVVNSNKFTVSGFTINASTGALATISGSPFPTGPYPVSVVVDPTGKFAYVANHDGNNVSAYTINSNTGVLTAVSGSPFPAGSIPRSVTVDPTGKFAYVANSSGANISGYTIDGGTGALTAMSGSPFPAGSVPYSIAAVGSILNSRPTATSLNITGTVNVGQLLTGHYTYSDVDGDMEGASSFRWLRDGLAIGGATGITYTLAAADAGHAIAFEVTPLATIGASPGIVASSPGMSVPTLQSISITPPNPSVLQGTTQQFTATGTYSNGSTLDITSNVAWTSTKTSVATINSTGLASGVSTGTSTIGAKLGSISGSTILTVPPPALVSISVTPANPTILTSGTQQFAAAGTYADGSVKTITTSVTWTSTNMSAATISSGGLAAGVGVGASNITAALAGVSGATTLTVQPVLVSITITPANPSIKVGTTLQFVATGTYSDNSTQNLSGSVAWTSSKPGIATITASGLATAVAKGTTSIKAKLGGITDTTTLNVTP
jgi:6-phosphogluconolactonase (cycloisomerase 2 family)